MSTLCAPVQARSPPHSVHGNARAPPWRGTDPPCRYAGHDDALSHHGCDYGGVPHSGAAWRARVSLATPRWCHPRHCGAIIPPVGKCAHWWDDCTTGGAAFASTPLVCSDFELWNAFHAMSCVIFPDLCCCVSISVLFTLSRVHTDNTQVHFRPFSLK